MKGFSINLTGYFFVGLVTILTMASSIPSQSAPQIKLKQIATGFNQVTDIQFVPDSNFMLVAEKQGNLFLLELSTGDKTHIKTFDVNSKSEMGLLSIAWYQSNLFAYYSPKGRTETQLSRFSIDKNSNGQIQFTNEKILLTQVQPFSNHNGGGMFVDAKGMLFLSIGDGGAAGDPMNNGQNPQSLLGSIIRIKLNHEMPKGYEIPVGNLHDFIPAAQPEILAMGVRNAWKISQNNQQDLFVADVGQNSIEEINRIPAQIIGQQPLNLGWRIMEGNSCYKQNTCKSNDYLKPIAEYSHHEIGQSITGGYQYEGDLIQSLKDHYVFADFVSGVIRAVELQSPNTVMTLISDPSANWSTFGKDQSGELYIADFSGTIYRLIH